MVNSSQNYSFPNISFRERIVGPLPFEPRWRSTIGVAGQFQRGPRGPVRISNRQDYAALYGEDDSAGALFVRQAMLQGATNFIISRSIPIASASELSLAITGTIPSQEAQVGYLGNLVEFSAQDIPIKTTGLELNVNYVGDALESNPLAGTLRVRPDSQISSSITYEGKGNIDLKVEEYLEGGQALTISTSYNQGFSNVFTATQPLTLATGQRGDYAALGLTVDAPPSFQTGSRIYFPGGLLLELILTPREGPFLLEYLVVQGGAVTAGELGYLVMTLILTSVPITIPANAYLDAASMVFVTITETLGSATPDRAVPVVALRNVQTSDGTLVENAPICSSCILSMGNNVSVTAVSNPNRYHWVLVNSALPRNSLMLANLKPGRILVSADGTIYQHSWYGGSRRGLLVMGTPLPTDQPNVFRVLVKGSSSEASPTATVALHETPENIYILSTRYEAVDERALSFSDEGLEFEPLLGAFSTSATQGVDSFILIREQVEPSGYPHHFLFVRGEEVVAVPSGVTFTASVMPGLGKVAFVEQIDYRVPIAASTVRIGAAMPGGAAFDTGLPASEVLTQLANAIRGNSILTDLLEEPELSLTLPPVGIKLKSAFTGSGANQIKVRLRRTVTPTGAFPDDLVFLYEDQEDPFDEDNFSPIYSMQGAESGSTPAYRDFYDVSGQPLVRVVALSDGAYGNNIRVTLTPAGAGEFSLFAVEGVRNAFANDPLSEVLNLNTTDVDPFTGLFRGSASSQIVRVFYLPYLRGLTNLSPSELARVPMRIAPLLEPRTGVLRSRNLTPYSRAYQGASYLRDIPLQSGSNGPLNSQSQQVRSMLEALRSLESEDVAILAVPGLVAGDERYGDVLTELISQVNRATPSTGLRHAIVQAPRRVSALQAKTLGALLANPRITLLAGHISMAGTPGVTVMPADGVYAGLLSTNRPEISPASASEGYIPNGILATDVPASPVYLDELTRSGLEVLYYNSGLRMFQFLNGLSTSRNIQDKYVSIRRMSDQILQDLYQNLNWVRSSQNTARLRSVVAGAVDSYLQTLVRESRIASFRPTICNDSNNPPSAQARGELNIAINYSPIYPADFIRVGVTREVSDSLTIQTQ